MKAFLASFLIILGLGRCTENKVLSITNDPLTIRTGTSYGMCVGYCQTDYVFNGTSVTLTQNGTRTQSQSPPKTCQSTISSDDWNTLKGLAAFEAFNSQPETIGCPDCADGGAEYIELQIGDRKHRVTFDPSKRVPGFEPLVDALRRRRDAFSECK